MAIQPRIEQHIKFFREILNALEEHRSEAQRDGNAKWERYLSCLIEGLYDSELPSGKGRMRLTLDLKKWADPKSVQPKPKDVDAFAEELADAYSTDSYGDWKSCIRALRKFGCNDNQIEAVIRSKFTRWAKDRSKDPNKKTTSSDLMRYITGFKEPMREIEELTLEHFGGDQ